MRIHVLVVPSCWPWSWGSEASLLATSSSISSSLFTTNRHMSPPGGGATRQRLGGGARPEWRADWEKRQRVFRPG